MSMRKFSNKHWPYKSTKIVLYDPQNNALTAVEKYYKHIRVSYESLYMGIVLATGDSFYSTAIKIGDF